MNTLKVLFLSATMIGMAGATTVDGRVVEVTNNGTTYSVKIQLKVDAAAGLGGATLALTYNNTNLSFPANPTAGVDYTFHGFNGGLYSSATVTRPLSNRVSANIEYNGGAGSSTLVNTTFADIVTINFSVIVPTGSSHLSWVVKEALADDGTTPWLEGVFTDLNTSSLPVTLSSFTGHAVPQGVRLDWTTLTEINNYGFCIQRRRQTDSLYVDVPNSFIAGHGTTLEPHTYAYTDITAGSGSWYYRLKQIDLDGTVHYSEPVQVQVLTDVKELAPLVFVLQQNYPNPFNPQTEIKFSVESTGKTTMQVYSITGKLVATLFDGVAEAGQYYRVQFSAQGGTTPGGGGSELASGVYFYHLQSGRFSEFKKMMILK